MNRFFLPRFLESSRSENLRGIAIPISNDLSNFREERYKCAVTHDVLNNSTRVAVLKPTGDVVTVECVEKIIKKDMVHPLTGQTLKESDFIYLHRGGTGYAAANDQLEGKKYRPALFCA